MLGLIFALVGNKILKSAGCLMVILGIYLAISIPSYLKKKDNNPSVKYKLSKFLISLLLIYPFIIGMILDYGKLIFFGIFSGMVGVAMFILTMKDFSRNHPL